MTRLRAVKSKQEPSWRDKLPDGRFIYSCPRCIVNGKKAASSKVLIGFNVPLEDGKYIYPQAKSIEMTCSECSDIVAIWDGKRWTKLEGL